MIKKLKVDGFKSLVDFEINFEKGLNVLVGPNGVGKTNIIQAMTILSSLNTNSLLDFFTQLGGVSSTFNLIDCDNRAKKITIQASGRTSGTLGKEEKYEVEYDYKIVLALLDELFIDSEELQIRRKDEKGKYQSVLSVNQDHKELIAKIEQPQLIGDFKIIKKGEKELKIELNPDKFNSESLLSIMSRLFYVCHLISNDFNKIKSFNIDPHVARMACDITEPKEMLGNGKYLANTLHSMSKNAADLTEINLFLSQLLPNYKEIKSEISRESSKRYFCLHNNSDNKFSSNSLSDGTIKLLALLVGVVRQKEKTTIIEEPENYLHPYANKLLIEYLRETFENGTCILTTHSETILNMIRPEELIICELKKGYTKCRRLENIDKLKEVIAKSGFGCGYHYIAGNLGGTPIN